MCLLKKNSVTHTLKPKDACFGRFQLPNWQINRLNLVPNQEVEPDFDTEFGFCKKLNAYFEINVSEVGNRNAG